MLLSGVGADMAQTMKNLRFDRWLPQDRVFPLEPNSPGSSTIKAVRHAYRLFGEDAVTCPHCAAIVPTDSEIYYMV